jgi:hypothetical protein
MENATGKPVAFSRAVVARTSGAAVSEFASAGGNEYAAV